MNDFGNIVNAYINMLNESENKTDSVQNIIRDNSINKHKRNKLLQSIQIGGHGFRLANDVFNILFPFTAVTYHYKIDDEVKVDMGKSKITITLFAINDNDRILTQRQKETVERTVKYNMMEVYGLDSNVTCITYNNKSDYDIVINIKDELFYKEFVHKLVEQKLIK